MTHSDTYLRIYQAVCQIPAGNVATYGQIAQLAGMPGQARLVGYALHKLPELMEVPWHRVMNARGEISRLPDPDSGDIQHQMLVQEGVQFDLKGRVDFSRFGWKIATH